MFNLGDETELVFERQAFSGKYDLDGKPVKPKLREITARGSLQPYSTDNRAVKDGLIRNKLEERGLSSSSAFVFYCDTELREDNQYDKTIADVTKIKGKPFFVLSCKAWDSFGTELDHYEVVLVRKDIGED